MSTGIAESPELSPSQAYCEFVGALDRWIRQVTEKSGSEKDTVKAIHDGIARNAESNIDYYRSLIAESNNKESEHYKIIEKVYHNLLI